MNTSYLAFIESALKEVADIANRNFGRVSGITKGDDNNQVLTQTDLEIGKYLIEEIRSAYPKHNIIDEEAGVIDRNSVLTWVIDPIDGTSNFAEGIPTYGTIIGLLKDDKPIAGGVNLPFFNEIIIAEKGKGSYCNKERINVTKETSLLSTLVAYAVDGHQENPEFTREEFRKLAEITLGIRNLRASGSVFDAIMVAKGKYGGYLNQTSKIWDNVGQQIVIEEAGGIYTDFFGKPMDYSNPLSKAEENFSWCTASPILHKQLQGIIHRNK
mgnify:CR=1 FL=1